MKLHRTVSVFCIMCLCCGRITAQEEKISIGIDLDPKTQVEESRKLAKELTKKASKTWRQKGDQHRSYFFKEANEEMPYRLCVPSGWDGKSE